MRSDYELKVVAFPRLEASQGVSTWCAMPGCGELQNFVASSESKRATSGIHARSGVFAAENKHHRSRFTNVAVYRTGTTKRPKTRGASTSMVHG